MWILIILATLVFAICIRVKKTMSYWKDRNVPYIKPFPILGNSAPIVLRKRSVLDHVRYMYNVYPDKRCIGVYQFMTPQLLIRDPELIKQITVKDFDHFTDRTVIVREDAEPILSRNLAGLKGQKWRDMRSTLSPSFTSSKMKFLFTLISDCAEQFIRHFEEKESEGVIEIEMKDTLSRFTNDAIASAAFGVTVDSLKDKENEFFLMGKEVTSLTGNRIFRVFGYSLFPWLMRLLKVSISPPAVSNFFRCIIKETIQVREEKGVIRPDMIHILLEARKGQMKHDEESHPDDGFAVVKELSPIDNEEKHQKAVLSDDDITAQALIFFFAGFETTSILLSFVGYELAVNPDIQAKLQHEIDKSKVRSNGKVNYESVLGIKYLDMVVSEALRRWTPGFVLDRVCVKDYVIAPRFPGEPSITIEKGTSVSIPVVGIHLDEQYFANPHKFDPERFSEENKNEIAPFTYMPFGSGPRNCIASRFALLETKVLLYHLLLKFDIVPVAKTPIPLVLSKKNFSMIPDGGLWLGFKPRVIQSASN